MVGDAGPGAAAGCARASDAGAAWLSAAAAVVAGAAPGWADPAATPGRRGRPPPNTRGHCGSHGLLRKRGHSCGNKSSGHNGVLRGAVRGFGALYEGAA